MISNIILCIFLYVLVFYINRAIYLKIQKNDRDAYPNPPAIFAIFLFLLGTIILLIVLLAQDSTEFFKYKK